MKLSEEILIVFYFTIIEDACSNHYEYIYTSYITMHNDSIFYYIHKVVLIILCSVINSVEIQS